MSPSFVEVAWVYSGFPRVSGDEPDCVEGGVAGREFSPRERG